jgi:hypothetical protein
MRLRRRQGVIGCKNGVTYKQEAPPGQKNNQNGLLQTGSPSGAFHIKKRIATNREPLCGLTNAGGITCL